MLLVWETSTHPWTQYTVNLAKHVKVEVDRSSLPLLYFCQKGAIKAPALDFLHVMNSQLAGLVAGSTVTNEYNDYPPTEARAQCAELYHRLGSKLGGNARAEFEDFYQRLSFATAANSVTFGIFHNLTWLDDSAQDESGLLCLILNALRKAQDTGRLKVLYTTNNGTKEGIHALNTTVAQTDKLPLARGGLCRLSQLRAPSYP